MLITNNHDLCQVEYAVRGEANITGLASVYTSTDIDPETEAKKFLLPILGETIRRFPHAAQYAMGYLTGVYVSAFNEAVEVARIRQEKARLM